MQAILTLLPPLLMTIVFYFNVSSISDQSFSDASSSNITPSPLLMTIMFYFNVSNISNLSFADGSGSNIATPLLMTIVFHFNISDHSFADASTSNITAGPGLESGGWFLW